MKEGSNLLLRLHNMEEQAISELFSKLWPLGCGHGHKVSDEQHETIEDVVLIVFTALIDKIRKGKRFTSIEPDLYRYFTTAVRHALRKIVRDRNRSYRRGMPVGLLPVYEEITPASILEMKECRHSLYQVIETLPEQCRRVIEEVHLEEMSASELARKRGVSKQCIYNLSKCAMRLLKEQLIHHQ